MTLVHRPIIPCLLVLVTVFISSSCFRQDEVLTDNIKIIAHRGYHLTKLENSMESFDAAYKRGYKHIEFDINFTKDFQPVVLHDSPLDNQSDTKGSLNDFYLTDIHLINLTGGYKIPVLDSMLLKLGSKFETFFIDMKEPCPDSGLVNFVMLIRKYQLFDKAVITSTNPAIVLKLKTLDANLGLGSDGDFEDRLYECINNKYKYILVTFSQLNKHLIYIAHAYGIKVYAFTPNSQQEMLNCLRYDIDGIMTDNPDMLRQF